MTVGELIEELQTLNPDLRVTGSDCCYGEEWGVSVTLMTCDYDPEEYDDPSEPQFHTRVCVR